MESDQFYRFETDFAWMNSSNKIICDIWIQKRENWKKQRKHCVTSSVECV